MNKIVYYILLLLFTSGFLTLSINFLNFKKDFSNVVPYKNLSVNNYLNLNNHLPYIKDTTKIDLFPYNLYFTNDNYKDINQINLDLGVIDSLYPFNFYFNRDFMTILLTDSLQKIKYNDISSINLDSISYLMQWAKGFMYYAIEKNRNQNLYASIYDYWMNFLSNYLTIYSENKKAAKFDNKFTYLANQCTEAKYNVAIKITSFEKVVYNLTNNYYGHLINASWNQSSIIEKIIFTFIILFTLFSYYNLISRLLIK